MKKLRLLLFEDCNRNCRGCCNKEWNLDKLPVEDDFSGYDEILLTGGEPMLNPILVLDVVDDIRKVNEDAKIYLYTTYVKHLPNVFKVITKIDGITVTLHEQKDVADFLNLVYEINKYIRKYKKIVTKSYHLNIFKGVNIKIDKSLKYWKIKGNIEWIKNCPLPKDEVFKRL